MLKYLATLTLGSAAAVSAAAATTAGISSENRAKEEQSTGDHQHHHHHPSRSDSSSASSSSLVDNDNMMDYRQEADRIANKVYEMYNDTDWKLAKTNKEIKVMYKKSPEFEGHIYRAECVLEGSPDRIVSYVLPSPKGLRGTWDKNVKESEVLEDIDENLIIARSATHSAAMGLISSRDFVDLIYIKNYDDGIVTTNSKSIQRKDCPPKDGFVRGANYHGGTVCIPLQGEQNKTKVINLVQSDLGGMLPTSLVESALPSNLIDFFVDLDKALRSSEIN